MNVACWIAAENVILFIIWGLLLYINATLICIFVRRMALRRKIALIKNQAFAAIKYKIHRKIISNGLSWVCSFDLHAPKHRNHFGVQMQIKPLFCMRKVHQFEAIWVVYLQHKKWLEIRIANLITASSQTDGQWLVIKSGVFVRSRFAVPPKLNISQ